jgi:hypothetical protein
MNSKELIKKSKKLGYEWEEDGNIIYLLSFAEFDDERKYPEWTLVIEIDKERKEYSKYWANNVQEPVTLEENKLLTEILEMLETEDE